MYKIPNNNNNNNFHLPEWQESRKGNCPSKLAPYKGNKLNTNIIVLLFAVVLLFVYIVPLPFFR